MTLLDLKLVSTQFPNRGMLRGGRRPPQCSCLLSLHEMAVPSKCSGVGGGAPHDNYKLFFLPIPRFKIRVVVSGGGQLFLVVRWFITPFVLNDYYTEVCCRGRLDYLLF